MKSMIKKEDGLYKLIMSMHKGEKRFFAVYCNYYGHAEKKAYLEVFKAIEHQKQYNETALKKKLAGKPYVGHLHVIKNYLKSLILNSLYLYKNRNNKSLRNKFAHAEIYYEKGMYAQAGQALYKLRKSAEEEEDFITLFETLRLEKRLMLTRSNVDEDAMMAIVEKEKHCFEAYQEICNYLNLGMEVGYIHFKYHESTRNIKDIHNRKIDKRDVFNNTTAPKSTYAGYLLHNVRGTYYRAVSQFEQASEDCGLALKVLEDNEVFKAGHPEIVFAALFNYITSLLILKEYKRALNTMARLSDFIAKNESELRENLLIKYFNMEHRVSILVGEKQDAIGLLEKMEHYINSHSSIPDSEKVIFYFNAVDMYFFYGDYSRSLRWLNKAINFNAEKANTTLYHYLRIMQVILLFEIKDYELMGYKLRSLYRYFLKQSALMKFEKVFIEFFKDLIKQPYINNRSVINLLSSLKQLLKEVFKDANEAGILQYFDILSWLESKIQKRPFAEIIKEKASVSGRR